MINEYTLRVSYDDKSFEKKFKGTNPERAIELCRDNIYYTLMDEEYPEGKAYDISQGAKITVA